MPSHLNSKQLPTLTTSTINQQALNYSVPPNHSNLSETSNSTSNSKAKPFDTKSFLYPFLPILNGKKLCKTPPSSPPKQAELMYGRLYLEFVRNLMTMKASHLLTNVQLLKYDKDVKEEILDYEKFKGWIQYIIRRIVSYCSLKEEESLVQNPQIKKEASSTSTVCSSTLRGRHSNSKIRKERKNDSEISISWGLYSFLSKSLVQ